MEDLKTVEGSIITPDPLSAKQREGVAKMRTSLLACSDPELVPATLKQITAQRIVHQVTRIVRYIDMMDKIEDALYASIDRTLEGIQSSPGPMAMATLLTLQERLQNNMINSHKILEPYLTIVDDVDWAPDELPADSIYDRATRDKVRSAAQLLLAELGGTDDSI